MDDFADAKHIEEIRRSLWTGREFGQAAVMVGAGFSKNAERVLGGTAAFPSWDELALEIDKALYPESMPLDARHLRIASVGYPRLAGEYAITFGRASLDNLVARVIPDAQFVPGDLHRLLISLPWSDVFTTNYDTLLERTQNGVFERRYDLVVTSADIVGRMKPRITKLHGSLPSHRPFIITEEDFRTYPVKFAPFVNMVQQSIMENALCLFGFSGNDPNFLHWIGWVRDNLGNSTPPIYLCGLLDLSSSERRYLEEVRRITPVDLSPLFFDYPLEARHAAALEWLLITLRDGAPPNLLEWPLPTNQAKWRSAHQLPPTIPAPRHLTDPGPMAPQHDQSVQQQILDLLDRWRHIHQEYPGWIVAPARNRRVLWNYTEQWISPAVENYSSLPPPFDLEMLYELNWRLGRMLLPSFENALQAIALVVEKYNPYPGQIREHEAVILPSLTQYSMLNWSQLGEWWVALILSLLRAARESLDDVSFERWSRLVEPVVFLRADWKAQWHYERSLHQLACLNTAGLREELRLWEASNADPFWEVKRASLLAELGDLSEAERICGDALSTIRSRITPFTTDYALLSREGWTMQLLQILDQSKLRSERRSEYRDRRSKLDAYRANPGPEIDLLGAELATPVPRPEPTYTHVTDHKTRRRTFSHRFSSSLTFSETGVAVSDLIPAFAFLRLYEEGSMPMRCGIVTIHSDGVCTAADWVFSLYPFMAVAAMIRSGKPEEVQARFSVSRVAMLPQHFLDRLAGVLIPALGQEIKNATGPYPVGFENTLAKRLMTSLSILLGQLCFRLSDRDKDTLFSAAIKLHHHQAVLHDPSLAKAMEQLLRQVLEAMDPPDVIKHLATLAALPFPGENGFEVTAIDLWPEPFNELGSIDGYKLSDADGRSELGEPINYLIQAARSHNSEVRRRAVLRLARLWDIGALSEEEAERFGDALWSQLDPESGLPSGTSILKFGFLSLPTPAEAHPQEKLHRLLLGSEFMRSVQHAVDEQGRTIKRMGIGCPDSLVRELQGATVPITGRNTEDKIAWDLEEAQLLLTKVASWWDEEKGELDAVDGLDFFRGLMSDRFSELVPLLTDVIVPHLVGAAPDVVSVAESLASELTASGFATLPVRCALLSLLPEGALQVAQAIRYELNGTDESKIEAAIRATVYWIIYYSKGLIAQPPEDLLTELIYRVRLRRQPGLNAVITHLKTVVDLTPELLSSEQTQQIGEALEYLLAETALPKDTMKEPAVELNAPIPLEERPYYRRISAELAYSLAGLLRTRGSDLNSVNQWQEACRNDLFPDVRRVWQGSYS